MSGSALAQQRLSKTGDQLQSLLDQGETGPFDVFIMMADRVDVIAYGASFEAEQLPQSARTITLIPLLQQKASLTQGPILAILAAQADVDPGSVAPLWITNAIYCRLGLEALIALDGEASIEMIELAPKEEIADAMLMPSPPQIMGANGHEASLDVIKANKLWQMGYTGNGRKALIIDTGTDPGHPALMRSFAGNYSDTSYAWFGLSDSPTDCDNHGTHVAGTILGLDRQTHDTIGVAFNGQWMASPAIECTNGPGATQALQWAIDPDGNPATTSDMPDAINNSWRFLPNGFGCSSAVQQAINALEAVGVAVICAAGNDYPDYSVGGPAYANYSLVNSFAVGAISSNSPALNIAGFSSRGPTECGGTGSLLIKPEVVAPGVSIRSSVRGGAYASYQGTSMASPHVAGAVLLLKEAFPNASGTQIKLALYYSAVDLGDPGEDNVYGNGLIDVEAAFYYLIAEGLNPAPVSRERDGAISLVKDNPCGLDHRPEINFTNTGSAPITSASFLRTYGDGYVDTIFWSGNILPGKSELITSSPRSLPASGRYALRMEIIEVNGGTDAYLLDNWDESTFSALEPISVSARQLNVCIGGSGKVEAEIAGNDPLAFVNWYDKATGGQLLGADPELATGPITSSNIYYMAPGRRYHLGPGPSVTSGGYFDQNTTVKVPFDVFFPMKLDAVTLLTNSPGMRIIQVRNAMGTVLNSKQVELGTGESRVELDFDLEPGVGYTLGLGFAQAGLWVQTIAPQKLSIPAVIDLTSSQNGQLAYFFDWEISYELPCPRVPAFVTVSSGRFTPSFTTTETAVNQLSLSAQPGNAKSYRWYLGDGQILEGKNIVHSYAQPGSYQVGLLVTGPANCSEYTEQEVLVNGITALDASAIWPGFTVFPNPTNNQLLLSWEGEGTLVASLFDVTGREIRQPIVLSSQYPEHRWSLASLPDGIFWIRVVKDGRVSVEKVVKTQ